MVSWLKNIDEKYSGWWRYATIWIYVTIWVVANVLFWVSLHNLDLMSNYSLIVSDVNQEYNCNDDFIDIREITDCNGLMQCPDYMTIYVTSLNLKIYSYILLNTVILLIFMERVREVIFKKREL